MSSPSSTPRRGKTPSPVQAKKSPKDKTNSYQNVLSNVIKEGILQRKKMFGWVKYRYVLRENDLRRYSTKAYRNAMKIYPINSDCHIQQTGDCEFTVKHKKHKLHLKAKTPRERDDWVEALHTQTIDGSQIFISKEAQAEKNFRDNQEQRKRRVSAKRNSVIANLQTYDKREVGSPKPLTQLDSVATNINHTRGRIRSLSAGSSEGVDVGRLSPELNAVNTPIDTTQRAYLRRRSRSIIRSSTVEAWDEDDVEKTKRENDDKVKKTKKQPMDYKSLGIKLTCGLLAALLLFYFSYYALYVTWYGYRVTAVITYYTIWCSIIFPIVLYFSGNILLRMLFNIPGLNFVDPELAFHFDIGKQRLKIVNLTLLEKSIQFLGIESNGLQFQSLSIQEISLCFPVTNALKGISIGIDGIYANIKPLSRGDWEVVKDGYISSDKALSKYLADATVAALDAKLKIFKATMQEKNKATREVHTPIASWKIMVDDIIDTLELTIQNTAIRIVAPTRNHEAEIGIEISKIGLAKVKRENREKRLRVFAIEDLCIRANYNEKKGEDDEVTSEENKNKNNATFEEKVDQNNDGRNVADHYDDEIFDPITISISLELPPVMQVLMGPLANLEEGVEKNIIASIEISSIHLKLNPIHFTVISIVTKVMAQYTTYQNKQYVKYKNSMVPVRRNEIATYKTNYRKFKAPDASKSEKQTLQTQLSAIEERMTHDQIILARWDAENWEIPSLRKFAHAESMLTNEQKMLVLQDFLYNRPMLDYSLDNRIEENSKMMDCVLLTLHLDNIILDVHNSKVKEEGFSVCVDEISVHARLHLIERNHESIATSAKISVKRLQLENFQEKQFELQYPSTICKHVSDTDDSFSNLIVIDYMAYFSGRSDIKVSLKGLNLIIGARTLEIIMSSVNSLLEPFSTSRDVPSSKNDDEEAVVDISNGEEPDPSFMEEETISGGFMGGSDIMVNISVKNINIFLLENVHEVVPAAFVFTLNLQAGIDSSLREETISLELKDTSFRQCVVNSHDEKVGTSHWHSVQFKYSRAASLLDFAGDDVDLCAYVHSYSDVNSRDGEHSVFLKMEDLDIKLSISQIFTLNSYIANVTDAISSDEDPAKKSKEMQMEKARRKQIIKELSNKRKQQMLDSFESIDEDNDGVLTVGEFERMLMTSFPNKLLNSEYKSLTFTMFTIVDEDDDSEISFEEFKSAMEDNTLFEAYCDINLKCHEYAGSDFVVPGQKQNTNFLNRIPSLSIVSNRSSSLSSGGQNSGKQKQRNVDEKEQEDRFWDILMKEGVVNREKSIQGQNVIDVQRKMVRACRHYEYARYAWMNYLSPALIEKQEIDYGSDEIWQLKPSSDSGAINVKELFNVVNTYTGEQRNISTDTVARAAEPFRMAMSVTMDIGGIYISLIDLNIPMPVPALEIVVDSIEVDLSSRYNKDHDIDVWKGHIYCLLYANYYNNLSCHQEPLIENAPISIMLSEYSPKNKQNDANHVHVDGDVDSESEDEGTEEDILDASFIGDVVNEENRPPVTMVEVAVAPLRINGSLMLTQLIDELNKAFAGHTVSSYDNLRHSNDIGDYGGFYILNNLKEKMSVTCLKEDVTLKRLRTSTSNSTTLPSSFVDCDGVGQKDEIEEKGNDVVESNVVTGNGVKTNNDALMDPKNTVTTASSDLCPCPFLTKTINGTSSLKQKSIRNTFNKYDDDDTGLITESEGEEVMYDILNIFKIPFEGHEDTIRDAIEKADDNMSGQISMLEFNDAVAILIKKLGMNKNRYTLNIHGFHYSNIQTPINSQTFAYECDALKDNGKVDAMSAIVIQHEERSEVGTVLRFKSILTITHKLNFQTDKEYLNIMLKLGDESKVFKLNKEVDSLHVPFKWVSAKTQMLIQFAKDENWRAIGVKKGGFQFLGTKSVGYDPIFATGVDGANVLLTHLPADNNVDIKLWTISILPQIKFRNDLPVPIFIKVNHNVHGQDEQEHPIISVKGGSVASVYGIDVGNYTNVTLKIALYRPSKRKKKRRKEYIVENKMLVEEDLPEGIKFSQDARFKINKDKIASSPHVGFKIAGEVNESIRIDGEWLNDDAPMILLSSLFWFKNLTGLPLECKLKTQKKRLADDDGGEQIEGEKVNFQLTGENYIFIDKPTEGATLKCKIKPYDRKKSKKMIHAEYADNTKTFTEYTEMYAGYWYEAYGRIPKNSKIRTKTGIFNFYTFPLWEPMNMYMPVTILPMYVVQNNLPFPIDVFAGNLFRDNSDNEEHACFNVKPGENCPIYRFFNLRKGDGPKVAIRATNREGNVLTWNEPVPIVYNENLVGESKFLYVQKDSNPNNRSICRASIGFDETGYNYNTIFLCFDIAKAPYRIENRSCTQTLFYWQYKHEHDIREILPMQYQDFVLPHPSGKPIICVAQAKAAKGEKKMEAKDLQSTRVDVDKIDTLYQVRGAKHHCYFKVKADGFVKVLCMGDSHYVAIEDEEHAVEELMLSKNYRLDLQIGAIIIAVADIVEDKDYREKKLPKKISARTCGN
jgi:Ca2+-binding EF-hand superfamily protein